MTSLCPNLFSSKPETDADDDKTLKSKFFNLFKTLKSHFFLIIKFLPYLWPKGKYDIQLRVVLSLTFLLISKSIGLATPFAYKAAVDTLGVRGEISFPWLVILLYGLGKMGDILFKNLVDTSFVAVTQNALKDANLETCKNFFFLNIH